MSIIKAHDIILHGYAGEYDITLRPLCDEHLPLLYKWNSDPEVICWSEGPDAKPNTMDDVHHIYKQVSESGYAFLIEADGIAIGECLLCTLNNDSVTKKYPQGTDIRRIDTLIGEKSYWGRGIGTEIIRILVEFAFRESVDELYVFCGDYNMRSIKTFLKNGFAQVGYEDGEIHLALTRDVVV